MKSIYVATLLSAMFAFGQEFVQAPSQSMPQEKPIVAVPLFVNKTAGHVTRVAPGVYEDKVKPAAIYTLDADTEDPKHRYVDRKVEYAAGEWKLPDIAAEVATDATTSAVASMGKWRVLSRSTPTLKMIDSEALFQGTGAVKEAASSFAALKQMDASYLLLGRINRFRVDETKGVAYGVRRWQVVTSISMDLQLIDVNTSEIVAGRQMSERIVMRVPEGVESITGIYDWEEALRAAVSKAVPAFMASVQSGSTPDVIQAAAPSVTLEVNSTPAGADVEFNGTFLGNTPCNVSLPAVPGVLSITAAGYEPWAKRLTPNSSMKINPTLQKTQTPPAPVMTPQQGTPADGGEQMIIQ